MACPVYGTYIRNEGAGARETAYFARRDRKRQSVENADGVNPETLLHGTFMERINLV